MTGGGIGRNGDGIRRNGGGIRRNGGGIRRTVQRLPERRAERAWRAARRARSDDERFMNHYSTISNTIPNIHYHY